ncbi:hypothetical protein ABZX51_003646 [Aspergillus tubingensis]
MACVGTSTWKNCHGTEEEKSSRKSPEKRALKRRDGNGGCDNQCSWPGTSSSTREGTKRGEREGKEGRKGHLHPIHSQPVNLVLSILSFFPFPRCHSQRLSMDQARY